MACDFFSFIKKKRRSQYLLLAEPHSVNHLVFFSDYLQIEQYACFFTLVNRYKRKNCNSLSRKQGEEYRK
jgi:hypothetical protein